ncbi:hypothetical protein QAD02_005789 [Eretmocerus hayati]|uniref:Uncharacterized protein n=1 Tax=Eretmocerus hayati TaxID=131215 RepID=A0ACC2NTT2_9HYME|nr:hypothetical protein QAD02_005789 [Eretmocerus hayati]
MYLETFVKTASHPSLYGLKVLVINLHNLLHLADDVENMGCSLMDYSAFCFENFLGKLKGIVEGGNKPVIQLCNKINDYVQYDKPELKPQFEVLREKKVKEDEPSNYIRVRLHDCELFLNDANSVVMLNSGEIMMIKSMTSHVKKSPNLEDVTIKGSKIHIIGAATEYPCDPSLFNMYRVKENDDETEIVVANLSAVKFSKAARANKSLSKECMGFAATQLGICELFQSEEESQIVTRIFTTTVPNSWVFMDENDKPLKAEDYDIIFQLARLEGEQPPKQWKFHESIIIQHFKTYDESLDHIKSLVTTGKVVEPRLQPSDLSSLLSNLPQIQNQNAGHSDEQNDQHFEAVITNESDFIHEEVVQVTPRPAVDISFTSCDSGLEGSVALHNHTVELNSKELPVPQQIHSPGYAETCSDIPALSKNIDYLFNRMNNNLTRMEKRLNDKLEITNERFNSIDSKVILVQSKAHELTTIIQKNGGLQKNPDFLGYEEFLSKHKLQPRPFKTLEDFNNFEALFCADETKTTIYNDLKRHLITTCNNHQDVKKTCTEIFERFFWRLVLISYTAQRKNNKNTTKHKNKEGTSPVKEKLKFNSTSFYSCLHDALSSAYYNPLDEQGKKPDPLIPDFSEAILLREIGQVINDSKDWDGGRSQRAKRSFENMDESDTSKRSRRSSGDDGTMSVNVLTNSQSLNIVPLS